MTRKGVRRGIKRLRVGLPMMIAVLGMMWTIASAAMAQGTSLCEKEVSEPPLSKEECSPPTSIHFVTFKKNAEGKYVAGKFEILAGSNTVQCEGLVAGTTENAFVVGGSVKFIAKLADSNCNLGCKGTELKGGELRVQWEAKDTGSVTGSGAEFKMECPFIFTCDYTLEAPTVTGRQASKARPTSPMNRQA